jgi:hypothetical protein
LPYDPADEARLDAERDRCWRSFTSVALAAIDGAYGPAAGYIASIEARFGPQVAERARTELWKFVRARARPQTQEPPPMT